MGRMGRRIAHHENAAESTGRGSPWETRTGDHHGARRRCGAPHWSEDHDGLTRGLGPAYSAPLEATGAQLGVDGSAVARAYSYGRRPPEGIGGNLHQGHAT